nr:Chain C, topoisomerase I-derived peptide [synthetic construct]
KLNYLDPR